MTKAHKVLLQGDPEITTIILQDRDIWINHPDDRDGRERSPFSLCFDFNVSLRHLNFTNDPRIDMLSQVDGRDQTLVIDLMYLNSLRTATGDAIIQHLIQTVEQKGWKLIILVNVSWETVAGHVDEVMSVESVYDITNPNAPSRAVKIETINPTTLNESEQTHDN